MNKQQWKTWGHKDAEVTMMNNTEKNTVLDVMMLSSCKKQDELKSLEFNEIQTKLSHNVKSWINPWQTLYTLSIKRSFYYKDLKCEVSVRK